jgi:hypothetical protein
MASAANSSHAKAWFESVTRAENPEASLKAGADSSVSKRKRNDGYRGGRGFRRAWYRFRRAATSARHAGAESSAEIFAACPALGAPVISAKFSSTKSPAALPGREALLTKASLAEASTASRASKSVGADGKNPHPFVSVSGSQRGGATEHSARYSMEFTMGLAREFSIELPGEAQRQMSPQTGQDMNHE